MKDWKDSLKLAPKTIDQRHRDVTMMADHFMSLEALQPRDVKTWTELIEDGMTASGFSRVGDGCRSFWSYLQDAGIVAVELADPFSGSFRLASRKAPAVKVSRQAFTTEEVVKVYEGAKTKGDTALADLIALGAYTEAAAGGGLPDSERRQGSAGASDQRGQHRTRRCGQMDFDNRSK